MADSTGVIAAGSTDADDAGAPEVGITVGDFTATGGTGETAACSVDIDDTTAPEVGVIVADSIGVIAAGFAVLHHQQVCWL